MRGMIIVNSLYRDSLPPQALSHLCELTDSSVSFTASPGHARHLARKAAESGADIVVAVGGDGTVNEVCNGLVGSSTALAVYPVGTANDLARQMKISLQRMRVCRNLAFCRLRPIDLIKVNGWHFATVGGIGLPCEALQKMENKRRLDRQTIPGTGYLRRFSYLQALLSLFRDIPYSRGEIEIKTERNGLIGEYISLLISNQPRVGHLFQVAPDADNHDGLCDLMLLAPAKNRARSYLSVSTTLLPGNHRFENIIRYRGRQFLIILKQPVSFFADGEIPFSGRLFRIEVIPQALRVLVPPPLFSDRLDALRSPAIRPASPASYQAESLISHSTADLPLTILRQKNSINQILPSARGN
jgi:YegS/Rv2252/BmrU family lipid kinase